MGLIAEWKTKTSRTSKFVSYVLWETQEGKKMQRRKDFRNSGTKVLTNEQLEQASECLGIGTQQYLKKNGWNFPKFGKIVNEE